MNVADYFDRHSGDDGRLWIDSTTWLERIGSSVIRLVSAEGVSLIDPTAEIEQVLRSIQAIPEISRRPLAEQIWESTEDPDVDEMDAPVVEEASLLPEDERALGAWPPSDDAEPGDFEDTAGEVEEARLENPGYDPTNE
jgi:hypothetical protein